MNERPVQIRPYRSGDADAVSAFMKRCFLKDSSMEVRSHEPSYYKWKYRPNPWGKPAVLLAESEHQVVGLFCIIPKPLKIGEKNVIAGETGDAYTDPAYQGRGLFYKMIARAFDMMNEQDIHIFFTTANEIALKIWTGLFRFRKVLAYSSWVRPLQFGAVFRKKMHMGAFSSLFSWPFSLTYKLCFSGLFSFRMKGYSLEPSGFSDPRIGYLWREAAVSQGVSLVKDSTYFRYRYGSNPEEYRICLLQKESKVAGAVVIKRVPMFGMHCALIVDWMVADARPDHYRALIRETLSLIKRNRIGEFAATWSGQADWMGRTLRRYGFLKRKKTIHLLCGGDAAEAAAAGSWHFTHGDSDNV